MCNFKNIPSSTFFQLKPHMLFNVPLAESEQGKNYIRTHWEEDMAPGCTVVKPATQLTHLWVLEASRYVPTTHGVHTPAAVRSCPLLHEATTYTLLSSNFVKPLVISFRNQKLQLNTIKSNFSKTNNSEL